MANMHLLKMPTFHSMNSFKSFPTHETSSLSHVSYFAAKLLRPASVSQNLRAHTISITPPANIIVPENPMVGRYISIPVLPAAMAFCRNWRAMASATTKLARGNGLVGYTSLGWLFLESILGRGRKRGLEARLLRRKRGLPWSRKRHSLPLKLGPY